MIRFLSFLLLSVCVCVMSIVCEVGLVPYVDAVPVMHVLLFALHACMLRECEGDRNAGVGDRGVVVVSAGHVVGTRGSGIVSSVVRGMRGVDGVCGMCMCLARGGVGGEGNEWFQRQHPPSGGTVWSFRPANCCQLIPPNRFLDGFPDRVSLQWLS